MSAANLPYFFISSPLKYQYNPTRLGDNQTFLTLLWESSTCPHLWASPIDRKSTRRTSSHLVISYAVFCLKKKTAGSAPTAATGGNARESRAAPFAPSR